MPFLRSVLCALLAGVPILGQASRPASATSRPSVAILGASVSAGFSCATVGIGDAARNETITLKRALAVFWSGSAVSVRDFSDLMTFTDPVGIAKRKVELALASEPVLVVAADFLFWFGYGHVRGSDEGQARLALLEEGLALLDRFTCPLVVGDLPDMQGANPRMLAPKQIPTVAMLEQLNARVRAWAKAKENVRLFALADYVRTTKSRGEVVRWKGKDTTLLLDQVLQEDLLHATRLGVAVLALRLAPLLRSSLPASSDARPAPLSFDDLAERLRLAPR